MKLKIKLLIFVCCAFSLTASSQKLEKVIKCENSIYLLEKVNYKTFLEKLHNDKYSYLKKIGNKNTSFTWLRSNYSFPKTGYSYCWDIFQNQVFPISGFDSFGSNFGFFNIKIETVDSVTFIKKEKAFHDSLKQIYKTEKEYYEYLYFVHSEKPENKSNTRSIVQISELSEKLIGEDKQYKLKPGTICFDLIIIDSVNMEFYIRDMKQLTRWHYKYPPTYLDKEADDAWTEIITYSADTLGSYPYLEENLWIMHHEDGWQNHKNAHRIYDRWKRVDPPCTDNPYLPSGRKHKYQSINDRSFFDGQFKVIKQADQRYLINTKHGAIYTLTPEKVKRIGQIDMEQYIEFDNQKLFIEDRDNDQIVFFAPVKWEDTKLPKPKIKTMNKEEMERKFKNVLE